MDIVAVSYQCVRDRTVEWSHDGEPIRSPAAAARLFRAYLGTPDREHLAVLALDVRGNPLALHTASIGGLATSLAEPRAIYAFALRVGAATVVIAHTHPSGHPEPSQEDLQATRQLVEAGKILSIPLEDHIILGEDKWHSLRTGETGSF
jgi:DNA repair protein RadC